MNKVKLNLLYVYDFVNLDQAHAFVKEQEALGLKLWRYPYHPTSVAERLDRVLYTIPSQGIVGATTVESLVSIRRAISIAEPLKTLEVFDYEAYKSIVQLDEDSK